MAWSQHSMPRPDRRRRCVRMPRPSDFDSSFRRKRIEHASWCIAQITATRLRGATTRSLVHLGFNRSNIRRTRRSVRRAGGVASVIRGGLTSGVEGFPASALGVFGPKFVGLRIAANRSVFGDDRPTGGIQSAPQLGKLALALRLDTKMIDTRRTSRIGD